MILTGSKIVEEVRSGFITLKPFSIDQVNPNTYNYRLGPTFKKFKYFDGIKSHFEKIKIPKNGFILKPGRMYLGQTYERIGSCRYAMSLIGRSSLGRLGLFLQISANIGHTQSCHQWTLELYACQPIKLYPYMIIGQVSFWMNKGELPKHKSRYADFSGPQESLYQRYNSIFKI